MLARMGTARGTNKSFVPGNKEVGFVAGYFGKRYKQCIKGYP